MDGHQGCQPASTHTSAPLRPSDRVELLLMLSFCPPSSFCLLVPFHSVFSIHEVLLIDLCFSGHANRFTGVLVCPIESLREKETDVFVIGQRGPLIQGILFVFPFGFPVIIFPLIYRVGITSYVISLYSTYTVHGHHRELEFGVNLIPLLLEL